MLQFCGLSYVKHVTILKQLHLFYPDLPANVSSHMLQLSLVQDAFRDLLC